MGGDGLAEPAGTCSLTYPMIFFAMFDLLLEVCGQRPGDGPPASVLDRAYPGLLRWAAGCGLHLFHLREFQFHRRRPAEDRHRHFEPRPVIIDLLDHAVE